MRDSSVPHLIAIGLVLLPVVTLPTGLIPEGLPVGIKVIVPFLSDLRVQRLAELFVAAAGNALSQPRN